MVEYLDILDERGEKTGESKPKQLVHETGLLHRTVHVWVLNSKSELLLQKRSPNSTYPGHWDISAAGHISSGQTSTEAAMRETEEELGVEIKESDLKYLFTTKHQSVLKQGTYINNEFSDVYLVKRDLNMNEMTLQSDEVAEVKWISLDEMKSLLNSNDELVVPHEEEYKKLFEYLESNQ